MLDEQVGSRIDNRRTVKKFTENIPYDSFAKKYFRIEFQ